MRLAVVGLALLLGGCAGASEEPTPATPSPTASPTPGAETNASEATLLPVGRAWTYEGSEFYNPERKFTVVVARADETGYLLAGGTETEITYNALWGSRWYGEVDRNLGDNDLRQLDLPLHDGKSWDMFEGYTLTARAADVATPRGTLPGFFIEGKGEGESSFRGEYAPEIGNFVKLDVVWNGGTIGQAIRMTGMTENAKWVWYELGDRVMSGTPQSPAQLDVPAGFDNVIVSAGGTSGSRVVVEGPGGAQWTTEFAGDEEWRQAMLPPTEGKWVATAAGRPLVEQAPDLPAQPPVGWSHVTIAPVTWIRG